jgi:hypothetical protein
VVWENSEQRAFLKHDFQGRSKIMTERDEPVDFPPYNVTEFSKKWNILAAQAQIILEKNGPRRASCDAAAVRLKNSLKRKRGHGY